MVHRKSELFNKISVIINTYINSLIQGNNPSVVLNQLGTILVEGKLPTKVRLPRCGLLAGVVVITHSKLKYIIFNNLKNVGKTNKSFLEAQITCALLFYLMNLGTVSQKILELTQNQEITSKMVHGLLHEIHLACNRKDLCDVIVDSLNNSWSLTKEKPEGNKPGRPQKEK